MKSRDVEYPWVTGVTLSDRMVLVCLTVLQGGGGFVFNKANTLLLSGNKIHLTLNCSTVQISELHRLNKAQQ